MKPNTLISFMSQINRLAFITEGLLEIVRPVFEDKSAGFDRCKRAVQRKIRRVLEDEIEEYHLLCWRCGIELSEDDLIGHITENLGIDEMMLTLYLRLELLDERIIHISEKDILEKLKFALRDFDMDLKEAIDRAPEELAWTVENMTGINLDFFRAPEDFYWDDDEYGWAA